MEPSIETQELIRYCVSFHFEKRKHPISITKFLKTIYKTKQKLPNNNPLKNNLPFYWYIHGPYSPPLLQLKEQMVQNDIIKENDKGLTALKKSRLCEHGASLQEARDAVKDIINELTSMNSTTIIEDVYITEAPYPFYISFKSRFQAKLHNFLKDPETKFKPNDITSILHQTIGELPNVSLFSDFKYSFFDFIEVTEQILNSKLANELDESLMNTSEHIFETFAKGVRILHHDPYFDYELNNWKEKFNKSIDQMEKKIVDLYKNAKNLGIKNIELVPMRELVNDVTQLKNKDKLIMITFLPPVDDSNLNSGVIDGSIFNKLDEGEFKSILSKFDKCRKAIVQYAKGDEMDTSKYKIIAS